MEPKDRHAESAGMSLLLPAAAMGCRGGRLHLGRTRGSCSPTPCAIHPPGSYQRRVPSPVAPVSCQALSSNIRASADPRFSVSEAMVDLYSNPTGPSSQELSQLWVQGELEPGQHLCASTQGQGRRRPEETKAEWPNSGRG